MQNSYDNQEKLARQNSCCASGNLEYAGFWVRMAAYMIDSVVVFAGLLIVRLIFAGISLAGGGAITGTDILFHYSLKDIILYALKVLYFIAFTYLTGTTLGKKAMNLRVVSKNPEEKLTLFNVVYRETVGRFLCSLPVNIGYIVAGIDSEKHGFHDLFFCVIAISRFIIPYLRLQHALVIIETKGCCRNPYNIGQLTN